MTDSNVHHLPTLDEVLGERMRTATLIPASADWLDVRDRASGLGYSRSRRRPVAYALVAAALAATAAIATPALGLDRTIVGFFDAEPAPTNVVRIFSEMNDHGSGGIGVAAGEAKLVHAFELPSGRYQLSVTSTERASFCWDISGFSAGCQTITAASGLFKPGEVDPVRIGLTFRDIPPPSMPQQPVLIGGNLRSSSTDQLQIEFADGSHEVIPFVWVSEPIDAGFFLYELPQERWQEGKRPRALSLHSQDGALRSRVAFSVSSSLDE